MTPDTAHTTSPRVLHIGKYFPPHRGGMESVLRDQMNIQVRDKGCQVAAVVHSSDRQLFDSVTVAPLGYRVRRAARWFTAVFAPIAPLFALAIHREIKALDPDEIKIHMPNPSAFWLFILPSAWGRRWLILWHSDVLPSTHSLGLRLFYRLYRPFETLLLKRADQIIATSPPYLETSEPLMPYRNKCIVEPLEIDVERIPKAYREASQPPKAPGEGIRVLCVGRLTYYKDFGTAIKAVAAIPDAQLHIVGEGEERGNLEELILQLDVSERIELLGELLDEEVWRQYTWCDVHVLPSIERTEAFGIVILEAGCFARQTITADISGSGMPYAQSLVAQDRLQFPAGEDSVLASLLAESLFSHEQ